MTTMLQMKARIADEIGPRDDLGTQIAFAITDAIEAYQDRRFHFNEGRATTFTTVAGQEFYDEDDAADLAKVQVIDYVVLYIGDNPYHLLAMTPAEIETASTNGTNTGQPGWYCWYGNQIRIYPSPADAWTIRIGCAFKAAAPTSDAQTGNPWMTHAERLVRSRAKLELALHVLKDQALAETMNAAVTEALDQLVIRTNQLTRVGDGRVAAMEF